MEYYQAAPGIVGGSKEKAQQQLAEIKKRDRIIGHRAAAQFLINDKKINEARNEYITSVREDGNNPKSHYGLGIFYLSVDKNNKGATDAFETSVKVDPNFMSGWFQIGHMAALMGTNFARGEEALRKYLAYTPKHDEPPHARAHYWLGQIWEKQGKKADAKAAYTKSLQLNPSQKDVSEALKRVS
jgi:TolA-binding protein